MDFLTPQFFDLLIIVVIIVGLALAAVRLYADFTRPLPPPRPPDDEPACGDDDTQPTPPQQG